MFYIFNAIWGRFFNFSLLLFSFFFFLLKCPLTGMSFYKKSEIRARSALHTCLDEVRILIFDYPAEYMLDFVLIFPRSRRTLQTNWRVLQIDQVDMDIWNFWCHVPNRESVTLNRYSAAFRSPCALSFVIYFWKSSKYSNIHE